MPTLSKSLDPGEISTNEPQTLATTATSTSTSTSTTTAITSTATTSTVTDAESQQDQEPDNATKADSSLISLDNNKSDVPMEVDPTRDGKESECADDGRPFTQSAAAAAGSDRDDKHTELPQLSDKKYNSPDNKSSGAAEKSHDLETTRRDQNTSESSDKSGEVVTISSDEPSQNESEESFESAGDEVPIVVILSSSEEMSSHISPQKRPLEEPLEPSKRARLDESATTREESGEKEDKKEKAATKTEETVVVATDVPPDPPESCGPTGSGRETQTPDSEGSKVAERMQVDEEDSKTAVKPLLQQASPAGSPQPGTGPSQTRLSDEREKNLLLAGKTTGIAEGASQAAEPTPTESKTKCPEKETPPLLVVGDAAASKHDPASEHPRGSKWGSGRDSARLEDSVEVKREQIEDAEAAKQSELKSVTPGEQEEKATQPADMKTAGKAEEGPHSSKLQQAAKEDKQREENPGESLQLELTSQPTLSPLAKEKSAAAPEPSQPVQRGEASAPAPPEAAPPLGAREFRQWKRKLLDKCIEGLHVCLSRFPTHYKSIYRLAYLYYASDSHRVSLQL